MKSIPEEFCETLKELLAALHCPSVSLFEDSSDHVLYGEMVCFWKFLIKYCRPSNEICDIRKFLARMMRQREIKNYKRKVKLSNLSARKKKIGCRCERDVQELLTKHAQADRDNVDSREAIHDVENKVFLLHFKILEMKQELKLCEENCNFVGRYVASQDTGSLRAELSPLSRVTDALQQVKTAVLREAAVTKETAELVKDSLCENIGEALGRDVDAVSLWHAVFSLIDQTSQQVEQMIGNSHSVCAGMPDSSCGLVILQNLQSQFVELMENVAGMERSNISAADSIGLVKSASVKLLKNWLLVQHPGDSELLVGTVEDFVELSIRDDQRTSVRKQYLSLLSECSTDGCSVMIADMENLIKQRKDLLRENVKVQKHLNAVLWHCSSLLLDVRWSVCSGSLELSQYSSAGFDFAVLSRLAEEMSALWTRELELFAAFPLRALDGINLHSKRPASRLLCPVTLRTRNPVKRLDSSVIALYGGILLLPPEAAAIRLANLLAFRAAHKGKQQCAMKLALLPKNNIFELRMKEEETLSTINEKLECLCQSLVALVKSFEENERNLLFWTSQPLSAVAKTMVVNGSTLEQFQQVRNMSSLCKSSSVHSGLNKLKSFHTPYRKRTDSM